VIATAEPATPVAVRGGERAVVYRTAALFFVALALWLPRGIALDRLVTPDEVIWQARSANFSQALRRGDLAHTYQYFHPGVTVMWLGAAGYLWSAPGYAGQTTGQVDQWNLRIPRVLANLGYDPLAVLVAGRAAMVLAIVAALTLACALATRLIGWPAAVAGFLLIAFDPFQVAHARLLHLDALLGCLMLLAVVAFQSYLATGRRRADLVIAGIAAGLAVLTRSSGLFLVPFLGLLLVIDVRRDALVWDRDLPRELLRIARPFAAWGAIVAATVVLLWPALWVDPWQTVRRVVDGALSSAGEGHARAIYFDGALHLGDPGWDFYPITVLWRTTPIVVIGLLLALVAALLPRSRLLSPIERRTILGLALFVVLFTIFMSLGAKKFDRYLLPVYAPLDLIAACGWFAIARWCLRATRPALRLVGSAIVPVALAVQVAGTAAAFPYYLSYYNPLLGGPKRAPAVMMVGWGEGLDQVGDYLNRQPRPEELTVTTDAWLGPLMYFSRGTLAEAAFAGAGGVERWARSDYYVLYITAGQQGKIPPEILTSLDAMTPVQVVTLDGLDYARVYDLRTAPIPDYFVRNSPTMSDWGGAVRLVAARSSRTRPAPGDNLTVTVYFQAIGPAPNPLIARLHLRDAAGTVLLSADRAIDEPTPSRTAWPITFAFEIPAGATPGPYDLVVQVVDRTTDTALPATLSATGEAMNESVIAHLQVNE
jgi:4-amino-4-deoxy-L-arabinose transferase-like glycosyltransferase